MSFTGASFVGDSSASSPLAAVATAVTFSGYHLLAVQGYSRTKRNTPYGECMESRHFRVGGQRCILKYYPNGDKIRGREYIAFQLVLDAADIVEPVLVHYDFKFVSQFQEPNPSYDAYLYEPSGTLKICNNVSLASSKCSMRRETFERSKFLKNDGFMIRCDVVVTKDLNVAAAATQSSVVVPPPDIQQHLGSLLQSQDGTDITFQVGGDKFPAHRCVVAARSAVFKAELFGSMKEGAAVKKAPKRKKKAEAAVAANTVIRIEDMDARVFGLLLGFIYRDSVPPEVEDEGESVWQHLLVAADRYDLPRLRLICEQRICRNIDATTVATILELAEVHHCQELKNACFEFLKSPENLQDVMDAGGLDQLISSCPSILKDFITKLVSLKSDN